MYSHATLNHNCDLICDVKPIIQWEKRKSFSKTENLNEWNMVKQKGIKVKTYKVIKVDQITARKFS